MPFYVVDCEFSTQAQKSYLVSLFATNESQAREYAELMIKAYSAPLTPEEQDPKRFIQTYLSDISWDDIGSISCAMRDRKYLREFLVRATEPYSFYTTNRCSPLSFYVNPVKDSHITKHKLQTPPEDSVKIDARAHNGMYKDVTSSFTIHKSELDKLKNATGAMLARNFSGNQGQQGSTSNANVMNVDNKPF